MRQLPVSGSKVSNGNSYFQKKAWELLDISCPAKRFETNDVNHDIKHVQWHAEKVYKSIHILKSQLLNKTLEMTKLTLVS